MEHVQSSAVEMGGAQTHRACMQLFTCSLVLYCYTAGRYLDGHKGHTTEV